MLYTLRLMVVFTLQLIALFFCGSPTRDAPMCEGHWAL
jgi:hypothetical protein